MNTVAQIPKTLEKRLMDWFDVLVPSEGPAETVEGELVRSINKILYRFYNDGDFWYTGYGCETAGPAAAYLMKCRLLNLKPELRKSDNAGSPRYEKALFAVAKKICDWIESKNGEYTKNTSDMLETKPIYEDVKEEHYDEDDEDYFSK